MLCSRTLTSATTDPTLRFRWQASWRFAHKLLTCKYCPTKINTKDSETRWIKRPESEYSNKDYCSKGHSAYACFVRPHKTIWTHFKKFKSQKEFWELTSTKSTSLRWQSQSRNTPPESASHRQKRHNSGWRTWPQSRSKWLIRAATCPHKKQCWRGRTRLCKLCSWWRLRVGDSYSGWWSLRWWSSNSSSRCMPTDRSRKRVQFRRFRRRSEFRMHCRRSLDTLNCCCVKGSLQ